MTLLRVAVAVGMFTRLWQQFRRAPPGQRRLNAGYTLVGLLIVLLASVGVVALITGAIVLGTGELVLLAIGVAAYFAGLWWVLKRAARWFAARDPSL